MHLRIAITFSVPSVHALEMNTILNHLLARHEAAAPISAHDEAKKERRNIHANRIN